MKFICLILTVLTTFHATSQNKNNLAIIATPNGLNRWGNWIEGLNDGQTPTNTGGNRRSNNTPPRSQYWVEYEWQQPVTTKEIAVYWWNYNNNIRLPEAYHIEYWDGNKYIPVQHATGLGLNNNQFNTTTFTEVKTTKLRVQLDSADRWGATLLEWAVYPANASQRYPPLLNAGADRDVMAGGKTYLSPLIKSITPVQKVSWIKTSGPGNVIIKDTTATFEKPGNYILTVTATEGEQQSTASIKVKVHTPPPAKRLDVVYTTKYQINSKLWNDRVKAMIVNWIPHCIRMNERTDLTIGEGGIDNFIEAAKANKGQPHAAHKGYVFSNAWVHQTVESICIALMVDAQGDKQILAAQDSMKQTLEKWIPIILAAQEPDGYLQTAYTLRDTIKWKARWSEEGRGNHEDT